MQLLEVVAMAGAVFAFGSLWFSPGAAVIRLLSALALALSALAFWQGFRWHAAPLYISVAGLALWCWLPFSGPRWTISGLGLLAVGAAAVLCWLYPVFTLPAPAGPFAAGVRTEVFRDSTRGRAGQPSRGEGDVRELVADLWYPAGARNNQGDFEPYFLPGLAAWPSRLRLVRTNARRDAPLSPARSVYPLILYSPAWNGSRRDSCYLFQELASRGFIVAAIDHPYGSGRTVFPDGRILPAPERPWIDFSTPETYRATKPYVEEQLEVRVADIRFLAGHLEAQSAFRGRIDGRRIGVAGYSFGGTAAAEAAAREPRIRAGVNIDGLLMGQSATEGAGMPFLYVNSGDPVYLAGLRLDSPDPGRRLEAEVQFAAEAVMKRSVGAAGGYILTLQGTPHGELTDFNLYSRRPALLARRPIPPARVLQILSAYTASYFEERLMGMPSGLLAAPQSPFAHVDLVKGKPGSK